MKLLYQPGSNINAATWYDGTPIFETIENSDVSAVGRLVRRGTELNQKLPHGVSFLEPAKNTRNRGIIALIECDLLR